MITTLICVIAAFILAMALMGIIHSYRYSVLRKEKLLLEEVVRSQGQQIADQRVELMKFRTMDFLVDKRCLAFGNFIVEDNALHHAFAHFNSIEIIYKRFKSENKAE